MEPAKKRLLWPFLEFLFLYISADNFASFYLITAYFASLRQVDYASLLLTQWDLAIPYTLIFFPFYVSEYFVLQILLITIAIFVDFSVAFSRKLFCSVLVMFIISTTIFILFPTTMGPLQSTHPPHFDLFSAYFANYDANIETAYNEFPSLHIASSWFSIRLFAYFFPESKMKKKVLIGLVIWFIGMTLSTLTLKYHYLIDVIAGMILAEIIYQIVVVKDIFKVERWNNVISQKKLVACEFGLVIITSAILYLAYPNYMNMGR
jgi:membrane-associated phospholipid phosphatase